MERKGRESIIHDHGRNPSLTKVSCDWDDFRERHAVDTSNWIRGENTK